MKIIYFLTLVAATFFFACSSADKTDSNSSQASNEWELQILDSIQVDYLGRIWDANFKNGFGYLKDI
ncbi:hypothetical protein ACWKSR_12935, partial [Campylobacter fetus subsp. venerealis]